LTCQITNTVPTALHLSRLKPGHSRPLSPGYSAGDLGAHIARDVNRSGHGQRSTQRSRRLMVRYFVLLRRFRHRRRPVAVLASRNSLDPANRCCDLMSRIVAGAMPGAHNRPEGRAQLAGYPPFRPLVDVPRSALLPSVVVFPIAATGEAHLHRPSKSHGVKAGVETAGACEATLSSPLTGSDVLAAPLKDHGGVALRRS